LEKILVVDDDKNICELLQLALMNEGYGVVLAYTADEAIKKCIEFKPDMMILDVMLPDKDGWHVCREVRKFSDIAIIMLTVRGDTFDKVLGLELGADDYITKPFDQKEVCARVKAIFRRMLQNAHTFGGGKEKVIEYDKLRIDMNRYELKLGGCIYSTPPKELELLFYLASNPNRVFTRDQLLDDVWGFEYYGDSRTIDVHIKRLRTKLEGISDSWALKTVWGVGYKFEVIE
jgi:DNA-binding response OmpR family regulator